MERRQRSYTIDSISPTPQEAAAGLDPLVQSINDQDGAPVYVRRRSSIFYVPDSQIHENEEKPSDEKKLNPLVRCFTYTERFSGILYALVASLLFTCSNFALKQLDIVLLNAFMIRLFVQALLSLGFIIYKGYRPCHDSNGLLIFIRSLFAAAGSISFYLSLSILPLPDVTTIRYTQVVWTAVLAVFIFHERINLPTIIACILTLGGVVCVAQPTFLFPQSKIQNETLQNISTLNNNNNNNNNNHLIGMLFALLCAISISMSIALNKKLILKNVRQSIIMFYFLFITLIVCIIIQIYYWNFSKSKHKRFNFKIILFKKDYIFATIISIFQLFPMILAQKSLKREHPSIVTVVQSSDILFAIILQNIFSSIKTNLLALIGSILVLTSIFIVGGHKLWLDRQSRTYIPASTQENVLKVETKN
ncbi:unnamed protein product [Rotaria sordida]|uniref:EamA domain-containing protein n=1 Tax=Rotaria sordida TaxID=392033 RepID=A0A814RT10_9BILA|nr:unnamed protein product [Rotaria sordida]CAF3568389.1 unnamed protein product [Rotaria sordida]